MDIVLWFGGFVIIIVFVVIINKSFGRGVWQDSIKLPNGNFISKEPTKFYITLKGCHHHPASFKLKLGEMVFAKHEKDNPADDNAVVFLNAKSKRVGYMDRNSDSTHNGVGLRSLVYGDAPLVCVVVKHERKGEYLNLGLEIFAGGYSIEEMIDRCEKRIEYLK